MQQWYRKRVEPNARMVERVKLKAAMTEDEWNLTQ